MFVIRTKILAGIATKLASCRQLIGKEIPNYRPAACVDLPRSIHSSTLRRRLKRRGDSEPVSVAHRLPVATQMIYGEQIKDLKPERRREPKRRRRLRQPDEDLHTLQADLEEARQTVEMTALEEFYDSDDEDYVEEVSFDVKSERQKPDNEKTRMQAMFGNPDPDVPMSNVPCSGCGAELHCRNPHTAGYMPSELFKAIPKDKLKESCCQRCVLMRHHHVALNVPVQPEEYKNIVSQIRSKYALCVLVVDVMDPESSIFPELMQLIGPKRPMYIVANKIDLVPKDKDGYLSRIRDMLVRICKEKGLADESYIHHIALVSAKTQYGIEELVSRLMYDWARKGDVYILGCTNVGKSSLFNSLMGSDYTRAMAGDFLTRATTCLWPGTTLNVLKFPIVDPTPLRLKKRGERLAEDRLTLGERVRQQAVEADQHKGKHQYLIGHVGRTFTAQDAVAMPLSMSMHTNDSYTFDEKSGELFETGRLEESLPEVGYKEQTYKFGRWCYDTPGVVNPEQVLYPRTFRMRPGEGMYVSGLARIDYTQGSVPIHVTFVGCSRLPIHVLKGWEMDQFYRQYVGTSKLGVPKGNWKRRLAVPALVGKDLSFTGGGRESVADITLSSLGFAAVTAAEGEEFSLRVYTPGGVGCRVRQPAMLPFAVKLRGKAKAYSAYAPGKRVKILFEKDYSLPQTSKFFGKERRPRQRYTAQ